MWNGKKKALTFSYDDGVTQDKRLIEIFDYYGMKGTFNLNSAMMTEGNGWTEWERGMRVDYLLAEQVGDIYRHHEVAVHTSHHHDLTKLDDETLLRELVDDKALLESLCGSTVVGMAYPYGTTNDTVVQAVKKVGLHYARTVNDTHTFELPEEPLLWGHTCHHEDASLMTLAEEFLALDPDTPKLFAVWGHSYEFDVRHNWEIIEGFCKLMANRDDIAYITNREALGL